MIAHISSRWKGVHACTKNEKPTKKEEIEMQVSYGEAMMAFL